MARRYLERFEAPYEDSQGDQDFEYSERFGVDSLHALKALYVAIDADIGALGVGWWLTSLTPEQRTWVSDHLLQCVKAVFHHVRDAQLHVWEMGHCLDEENKFLYSSDQLPPDREKPIDELIGARVRLHIAATLHSIQGAFDCMGAAMVGVAGLPVPLITADLASANRAFERASRGTTDGERFQEWLWLHSQTTIAAAGPRGWNVWAETMRNTLAHRPMPLIVYGQVTWPKVTENGVVGGRRSVPQLPAEPDALELQEFVEGTWDRLPESAEDTLQGCVTSADAVAGALARAMQLFWEARRRNPALIPQPERQWRRTPPRVAGFPGYAYRAELEPRNAVFVASSDLVSRLRRTRRL